MKLSIAVANYVDYKQSLGMRFATEARTLKSFCRNLGDIDVREVETDRVCAYLAGDGPVTGFWHRKHSALRGFYRFAVARGYAACSPLPLTLPVEPPAFVPYIYSRDEIRRLLAATAGRERCNLSSLTCRTLLLLLYGTGVAARFISPASSWGKSLGKAIAVSDRVTEWANVRRWGNLRRQFRTAEVGIFAA